LFQLFEELKKQTKTIQGLSFEINQEREILIKAQEEKKNLEEKLEEQQQILKAKEEEAAKINKTLSSLYIIFFILFL